MERTDLTELHFLTHIDNVASIMTNGILSNRQAARLPHRSVADPRIQSWRERTMVPGGLPLHDYANLYINGRNAMLFRLVKEQPPQDLAVIAVDPSDLLDAPGAVICDRNAAKSGPRFLASPEGLGMIDREVVFAEYWTNHDDPKARLLHETLMCAEFLVPDLVEREHFRRVYVSCGLAQQRLIADGVAIPVVINARMFFGYSMRGAAS